jgi:hypothetical protein
MKIASKLEMDFLTIGCLLLIIFFSNFISAQIQGDRKLEGTWELKQFFSSEKEKNLTLNIKYSEKHKRYFGNVVIYGSNTTLDSLSYNNKINTVTFSSHIRNREYFNLTIKDDKMEGTVISNGNDFRLMGNKISNHNLDQVLEYGKYQQTRIPDNPDELYLETGNKKSEIVLLIVPGGPFDKIHYTNGFNDWNNKLHLVFVKQAQMINPTILPPENNLKIENAYQENLISVEILQRVIKHFKSQNKKVLVWGVSYGAWIIQKYIAEYGIEADAISISAGRLDLEDKIWKNAKQDQIVYDISYEKNDRIYTQMELSHTKPQSYLLSSISEERYTETLNSKDLSKFVLYQYGQKDGTVGKLNETEIEFLKSKNIEIDVCKKCYHRQMLSTKISATAINKMIQFVVK